MNLPSTPPSIGLAIPWLRTARVLVLACLFGCKTYAEPASPSPNPAAPQPIATDERGSLIVGVADVDITPPPGLSLFGHGPEGRRSTGTLLRLHCQVFYFGYKPDEQGRPEALALVPCDLPAPSLLLQRRVAKLIHEATGLGADRIVMAATHTHAGPAHYFGAVNYASLLSTQASGFSDETATFLATKIASAIDAAYDDARSHREDKGCVAWAERGFRDAVDPLPRFGKNRSVEAFADNTFTREESGLFVDADHPATQAVDGTLSVLRVDRCDAEGHSKKALGVFAVLGVHPTGMPNTNELYHGDIFGFADREIVARFTDRLPCPKPDTKSSAPCFVAGIANGVSGDVSPTVDFQGPRETRRIGHDIAQRVFALWREAEPRLDVSQPLRVAYRELQIPGAEVERPNAFYGDLRKNVYAFPGEAGRCGALESLTADAPRVPHYASFPDECVPRLCDQALLGTAFAGGSEEGRTFLSSLKEAREGALAPSSITCHAPKLELHRPFESPRWDFPRRAPISAILLGDRLITTFPAEVTTLAGYRARTQIERWITSTKQHGLTQERLGRVVQITLTNEYLQYITTHEEFQKQQYEGASNLYGPDSARFLANQQLCLVRWIFGAVDPVSDKECTLGQELPGVVSPAEFQPQATRSVHLDARCSSRTSGHFVGAKEPDRAFCQPADASRCSADVKRFTRDGEAGFTVRYTPPSDCASSWIAPRARIVFDDDGREVANDDGDGIEVTWLEGEWRVSWVPDKRELSRLGGRAFRFELRIDPSPGGKATVATSSSLDPDCR